MGDEDNSTENLITKTEKDEVIKIRQGQVDDLVRQLVTVSGTALLFAGTIMAWLNSYLSKLIPHMDVTQVPLGKKGKDLVESVGINGSSPTAANARSATDDPGILQGLSISYKTLELIFISLASAGVGILLGVAFIAYNLSKVCRMLSTDEQICLDKFKRLKVWSKLIEVFFAIGMLCGFLSVAFSILLFHSNPFFPFLCFVIPLIFCVFATIVSLRFTP